MDMNNCISVQRAMHLGGPISPDLSAHIAGCRHCQGALAERYGLPAPNELAEATCDDMGDLPAYLDCERAEGEPAAAARYPHVWWHLWICPACAEGAALTRALLDAEAAGDIGFVPAPHAPALQLDRAFVHELFASQQALGPAWAIEEPALLVAEAIDGIYRVALLAQPLASASWRLSVVASPPVRAIAVIRIGARTYRAAFDKSGTATLPEVPAGMLTGPYGPPLEVLIEPFAP